MGGRRGREGGGGDGEGGRGGGEARIPVSKGKAD